MDRHVVTKQEPRPIKQILKDLKAKLEKETLPDERAYLSMMISYYEDKCRKEVIAEKQINPKTILFKT